MVRKLLVANRGEIAIRIMRAAAELRIPTVAIYSPDDAGSLHVRRADEAHMLTGTGAAAYLDLGQVVSAAREYGCDAIHPGYGFLSENPALADACATAGIVFVGPQAETLEILGDKTRARALAVELGVPVLRGSDGPVTVEDARDFLRSLGEGGSMVIKAVAGGGGRGMRIVSSLDEVDHAYTRCQSEALAAFGNSAVYCEERMVNARHIEIQVAGDGTGAASHLWERDCTIQRRHQKLVEIAPSPAISESLRMKLTADAVRMAEHVRYRSLGTFEFLVEATPGAERYAFIEANPRLQVEHTVTEAVLGTDLVQAQLQIAAGASLEEAGLNQPAITRPRGFAIQLRINTETVDRDGNVRPSGGTITAFELPSGPGIRVDSCGFTGFKTNPSFDSLLAKLVVQTSSQRFEDVAVKAYRALCEFHIEGVNTNLSFLQALLQNDDFIAGRVRTLFLEDHAAELAAAALAGHPRLYVESQPAASAATRQGAGARIDVVDPLAVLSYGKAGESARAEVLAPASARETVFGPDAAGTRSVRSPMQATIVSVDVREGDTVRAGQQLAVINAMKMEHVISAESGGIVLSISVIPGDAVLEGEPILVLEPAEVGAGDTVATHELNLDHVRADLAESQTRHHYTLDEARPEAVARRRKTGRRTARENIGELCDPGSFVEYGPLVIAAQRARRTMDDLIRNTPADGMVTGIGRINGNLVGEERAQAIVMSYDYTVLAGTQGSMNHYKKDRLFELAERLRLPVVLFAEGGGGRPGDTDKAGVSGLDTMAFHLFGKLSGLVPLVGITSGRCFAGNAALLGCCDVVIATKGSNIGMGGPAMIEGGGLGVFRPEEIGPMDVQVPNGVVDIPAKDETEAVNVAARYLSYFQGPVQGWECADQRLLRAAVPENRLRVYDIRKLIETLADSGSVLELRREFGLAMVTAFARIEGRPIGIIANNPLHLSGAIDSPAADKAARFMQLCDAFDIPLVFLCDTPGIMVGPEVEKTGLVRHASRMFVVGASITVPFMTVVIRKSYGLGAQAMAGGSHKSPIFTTSWPTGEFGGMGLEGAVKLGQRRELEAIEDPLARKAEFDRLVARAYERGKAINSASHFEIDDVIDPADTRRWIMTALRSAPPPPRRDGKKRPCVDTW